MKKNKKISDETNQRIIELFLCSDDRRLWVISKTLSVDISYVTQVIQDYYNGNIDFKKGNFFILHSSINNF